MRPQIILHLLVKTRALSGQWFLSYEFFKKFLFSEKMSFKTKRNRTVAEGLKRVRELTSTIVIVATTAAATSPATTAQPLRLFFPVSESRSYW